MPIRDVLIVGSCLIGLSAAREAAEGGFQPAAGDD
jgi:NADPH-dependent 2,4-dienoyl-CoA reductase/sulfur reductase-like enzyme